MFLRLDSLRRRHRRRILIALAALAVATATLAAHASLAGSAMDDHQGDTVTVCVAAASTLAAVGAAAFALTRLPDRPLWTLPAPRTPVPALVPSSAGLLVRAGPPPALLQVFRF